MPTHTYEISIRWSSEDQAFLASAPELAGCIAHGETDIEALNNLHEAMQLWLDTAKEFGDAIPVPRNARVYAA
ncbi:MAG: type II toxin-antitoxin system HicB family antitoxin [Candidatus Kapaibacterium sp.]|nr:MAG: type II toxin-antitoxin system HicB family antitoxin [Candidatus Kapabacteria bacterium]